MNSINAANFEELESCLYKRLLVLMQKMWTMQN